MNLQATLPLSDTQSVRAAVNFAKESLNVATQYLDWLTLSEVKSARGSMNMAK